MERSSPSGRSTECACETPTPEQRLAMRSRPEGRHVMRQSWRDLLFVHWRIDPAVIQATLPAGLSVDTFAGQAWIGIVPFFMRNVRWVWTPPLPGTANFQELNVRTYVHDARGVPGVWFYSLDANCWPAVKGARWTYHLPYHWAKMTHRRMLPQGRIEYESRRRGTDTSLTTRFDYEPAGDVRTANDPESFEFFLVERYVLFAQRKGRLYSGQVHHPPYPVRDAVVHAWDDHALQLNGFARSGRAPDHTLMSQGVDVDVFPLRRVDKAALPAM